MHKKDETLVREFIVIGVMPIEVKAGNTATKSLNRFIDEYNSSIAYKIMSGNIDETDRKISIPHYMAMFL